LTQLTDTTYTAQFQPGSGAGTMTVDVNTGGFSDLAGNPNTDDNAAVSLNYEPPAGKDQINLGVYGKLIAPVQVEGKWYYHWDRSGDGTSGDLTSSGQAQINGGVDWVTHDTLDSLFNKDINGNINTVTNADGLIGTNDTFRYHTFANGVKVALPTYGGPVDGSGYAVPTRGLNKAQDGTAVSNNTTTDNPTYNDLLAIWDSQNGTGTSTNVSGKPPGWQGLTYWSATPSASGHAGVYLDYGVAVDYYKHFGAYVALQVL